MEGACKVVYYVAKYKCVFCCAAWKKPPSKSNVPTYEECPGCKLEKIWPWVVSEFKIHLF